MSPKALRIVNLLGIILGFLIAEGPHLLNVLAPYPRACAAIGVAIGVLSSFSRLCDLLKSLSSVLSITRIAKSKNDDDVPPPPSPLAPAAVFVLFTSVFLLAGSGRARGQTNQAPVLNPQIGFTIGETGTCQMAAAISALQVNLKTGDAKRVAFLGGFGCTFHNWVVPYGATVYVGEGVSSEQGSAPQANLLFQFSNWIAFGPGVQLVKGASGDRVFQGLMSVVGTLNFGGTPVYMKTRTEQALRANRAP